MAKTETGRVTLADVAVAAGVSAQTVSRVVNDHPYVSDTTRTRVQDAIRALGYRPNRAARSLATKRSCMLGLIGFAGGHYGPTQMVYHIERTARTRGYGVSFASLDAMTYDNLARAVDDLGLHDVDGLVFITPVEGVSHADIAQICGDLPYVQVDTEYGAQVPSVIIDQQHGSILATQHLLDLGHQDIATITGPLDWYGARVRLHGWQETLRQHGLMPGPTAEGQWTARSGYETACRLLELNTTFTALFAGNDQMALGAIRALRERGLRVPEDISVVGFDDVPEAAYFDPPLTTIRQDFAALGEQSVEYLVAQIDKPQTALHQRALFPQLIRRQSTRALP